MRRGWKQWPQNRGTLPQERPTHKKVSRLFFGEEQGDDNNNDGSLNPNEFSSLVYDVRVNVKYT